MSHFLKKVCLAFVRASRLLVFAGRFQSLESFVEAQDAKTLTSALEKCCVDAAVQINAVTPSRERVRSTVSPCVPRLCLLFLLCLTLGWSNSNHLRGLAELNVFFFFCGVTYLVRCSSLRDNKLSGAIPASLGNLVNLEELWLNANQIEGETDTDGDQESDKFA